MIFWLLQGYYFRLIKAAYVFSWVIINNLHLFYEKKSHFEEYILN